MLTLYQRSLGIGNVNILEEGEIVPIEQENVHYLENDAVVRILPTRASIAANGGAGMLGISSYSEH